MMNHFSDLHKVEIFVFFQKIPGVVAFFAAKDIPGDNSFMPMNAGIVGIAENEPIFLDIETEVQYNGQPCGMIVAKTMALAHSVANKVEITYQKTQLDRPIIPSLKHWRQRYKLSACNDSTDYHFAPNCKLGTPLVGQEKRIRGFLFQFVIFSSLCRKCHYKM